ncbi:MAG: spore maturation protein [Clostridia bacterium]|nr:spore maturation protein [Clostridia bacterium]
MSVYIIPCFILVIVISCFIKRVNVYEAVTDGAADGLKMLLHILPTMIIMLTAVSMLRASGLLSALVGFIEPFMKQIGVPAEIVPMVLLRPVSGSGSFGLLTDCFNTYGADSIIGRLTSVIMGSTETTFYTIAVYYAGTGIKDVKKVIPCAVLGDLVSVILACIIVK